jgi:hypothetical protein
MTTVVCAVFISVSFASRTPGFIEIDEHDVDIRARINAIKTGIR